MRERRAVTGDVEIITTHDAFRIRRGRSTNAFHDCLNLARQGFDLGKLTAEYLDPDSMPVASMAILILIGMA